MAQDKQNGTVIRFLGGNNEKRIGENSILIEHEDNKRIMLDLGALFPPEWTGLDAIIPDVRQYFAHDEKGQRVEAQKPVDAIFISHCHEDHIGGLIGLARAGFEFPPVYASKYTTELIGTALKEAGIKKESINLKVINEGECVDVAENIKVSPFNVSHSTVGAMGYYVETRTNGRLCAGILNPGDYRLGESKIGPGFDEGEFKEFLRDKPVTHVLLDSTSTDNSDEYLVSFEEAVENTLAQVASNPEKQVVSAVISRSLQNMAIDLEVAKRSGRTVFIDGYWARLAFEAMRRSGLHDYDDVVFGSDNILKANARAYLSQCGKGQRYIIPSGAFAESQKGKKSGLYKMSEQQKVVVGKDGKVKGKGDTGHPDFTIDNETLVLARQRCIEEINGKQVRAMYQRLAALGATVIENKSANNTGKFVTVLMQRTGHAVKSETIKFIKLISENRKNASKLQFLPIHGDHKQLNNTAKAVISAGEEPSICYNADAIKVYAGGLRRLDEESNNQQFYIAVQEESVTGYGDKNSRYIYTLVDGNYAKVQDLYRIDPWKVEQQFVFGNELNEKKKDEIVSLSETYIVKHGKNAGKMKKKPKTPEQRKEINLRKEAKKQQKREKKSFRRIKEIQTFGNGGSSR